MLRIEFLIAPSFTDFEQIAVDEEEEQAVLSYADQGGEVVRAVVNCFSRDGSDRRHAPAI